jgi:hypothetical protein
VPLAAWVAADLAVALGHFPHPALGLGGIGEGQAG